MHIILYIQQSNSYMCSLSCFCGFFEGLAVSVFIGSPISDMGKFTVVDLSSGVNKEVQGAMLAV